MRELAAFSEQTKAEQLASFLLFHDLETQLEEEENQWTVWILNDDHRDQANQLLQQFQQGADPALIRQAEEHVEKVRKEQLEDQIKRRRSVAAAARLRQRWDGVWYRSFPVTVVLISISFAVALLTSNFRVEENSGSLFPQLCNKQDSELLQGLYLNVPLTRTERLQMLLTGERPSLYQIVQSGQVWRFVTPIFLHFDFLHILFNMFWMWGLARGIEYLRGSFRFAGLVLVIAVVSNVAQWYWAGWRFGGMSGVVFGLIGYAWMKGRYEPHLGIGMRQEQIVYSMFFLFLGMGGLFGSVANVCHIAGLLTGIVVSRVNAVREIISGR